MKSLYWAGRTVLSQIKSLDCEHDERVKFFMTVYNSNQISGISMCKDLKIDQELFQRVRIVSPPERISKLAAVDLVVVPEQ
jgi:hypothetical protein